MIREFGLKSLNFNINKSICLYSLDISVKHDYTWQLFQSLHTVNLLKRMYTTYFGLKIISMAYYFGLK